MFRRYFGSRWPFPILLSCLLIASGLAQQTTSAPASPPSDSVAPDSARSKQSDKEAAKKAKELQRQRLKELQGPFKKWINEDVRWIISPEEESAFKQLATDEERDQFIEQFWQRRDPTPDTLENEFKDEHYRRIAYANEHFAAGTPGWRTDRGRIYIVWGPADGDRFSPRRRPVSARHLGRRRFHLDLSLRALALSVPGRRRAGSHHRDLWTTACATITTSRSIPTRRMPYCTRRVPDSPCTNRWVWPARSTA